MPHQPYPATTTFLPPLLLGAVDAIPHRLPGSIAVVEKILHIRVIDRYDRKEQGIVPVHGTQPHYAGGGFLTGPDDGPGLFRPFFVQQGDQIGTVIDYGIRPGIQGQTEKALVFVDGFAVVSENRDAAVNQRLIHHPAWKAVVGTG